MESLSTHVISATGSVMFCDDTATTIRLWTAQQRLLSCDRDTKRRFAAKRPRMRTTKASCRPTHPDTSNWKRHEDLVLKMARFPAITSRLWERRKKGQNCLTKRLSRRSWVEKYFSNQPCSM